MKKELSYLVLGTLLAMVPMGSHGQTPSDNTITVTANRDVALVKEEPTTKVIVTREELNHKAARTLNDALVGQQSIQMTTDDMGRQTVSIRGAEARHTLILLDGQRLMGGLSKFSGPVDEINRISTDEIDHVEILRGAESTKYGADALGGVVNVVRKMPKTFGMTLQLEKSRLQHVGNATLPGYLTAPAQGSGNQGNSSIALHTGQLGPINAVITYGVNHTEPMEANKEGESVHFFGTRKYVEGRVRLNFDAHNSLLFEKSRLTEDLLKITHAGGPFYIAPKERAVRNQHGLTFQGQVGDLDYKIRSYESDYNVDSDVYVFVNDRKIPYNVAYPDTVEHKDNAFEGSVSLARGDHYFTLAASNHNEFASGTRIKIPGERGVPLHRIYEFPNPDNPNNPARISSDAAGQFYVNHAQISSQGYMLDDAWQVNDKLLVMPAIRYDKSSKFKGQVSAKIGATYKIKENIRLKANVGTGFSAPGVAELYHNWEMYEPSLNTKPPFRNGWLFLGNPNLKPEKSLNMDVSIEADLGKRTSTKLTLFRNNFRDFMQIVYDGERVSPGLRGFTHFNANVRYYDSYWAYDYDSFDEMLDAIKEAPEDERLDIIDENTSMVSGIPAMDDAFTYANISHAKMQGVEWELTQQMGKHWTAKVGYTYLDARDTDTGKRLEGRGNHMFNATLSYQDVKRGWAATFWGNYTMNFLDIRDREATGRFIDREGGPKPAYIFDNPKTGRPVYLFDSRYNAEDFFNKYDKEHTFTVEKIAKKKNFGVWNFMLEKYMNKDSTVYFGINNVFDKRDYYLGLGGRVYRLGMKVKV